jgi:hypothetical protein
MAVLRQSGIARDTTEETEIGEKVDEPYQSDCYKRADYADYNG